MRTSDQARAYGVWARAAGEPVGANARPRSFARGVLTVECASSVWANELTYLTGQLLARMTELDPGHPVERLRFVSRPASSSFRVATASQATPGAPASAASCAPPAPLPSAGTPPPGTAPAARRPPAPPGLAARQDEGPAVAKRTERDETLDSAALAAAAEGAQAVRDERLRRAILAALGAARTARRPPAGSTPSVNQKM
mgnify:CR=1 FL=1